MAFSSKIVCVIYSIAMLGLYSCGRTGGQGPSPNILGDATSWTARTMPVSANWKEVTYGNGTFVAIAGSIDGNGVTFAAYSKDGKIWHESTLPTASEWNTVSFGNGVFVAVGNYPAAMAVSTDGITWSASPFSASWASTKVTFGNSIFVAMEAGGYHTLVSADGIRWNAGEYHPYDLPVCGSIVFDSGNFKIYCDGRQAFLSADGITWTSMGVSVDDRWVASAYGNDLRVIISDNTNVYVDPDADPGLGPSYFTGTLPSSSLWAALAFGNGVFVAVAGNSLQQGLYSGAVSSDGINWTGVDLPSKSTWTSITYGEGIFVAISSNENGGSKSTAAASSP